MVPMQAILLLAGILCFGVGVAVGLALAPKSADLMAMEQVMRAVLADAGIVAPVDRFALVDDDPFKGDAQAPIVIVEFSAYGCPYCKQFHDETLPSLLENYGQYIRYVYRDMPTVNPEVSFPAAMASNCADEQNQFWQYHDALFARQTTLSGAMLVTIAEDLSLDMEAFRACMDENRYYSEVNADFYAGSLVNVTTTPNFFINGEHYTGAQPYAFFESIILDELAKAGINPVS